VLCTWVAADTALDDTPQPRLYVSRVSGDDVHSGESSCTPVASLSRALHLLNGQSGTLVLYPALYVGSLNSNLRLPASQTVFIVADPFTCRPAPSSTVLHPRPFDHAPWQAVRASLPYAPRPLPCTAATRLLDSMLEPAGTPCTATLVPSPSTEWLFHLDQARLHLANSSVVSARVLVAHSSYLHDTGRLCAIAREGHRVPCHI